MTQLIHREAVFVIKPGVAEGYFGDEDSSVPQP